MKICQVCNQTYVDDNLNFCLTDGGILTAYNDDAPPTVMLNRTRTTQQNWENYQTPPTNWDNQPLQQQHQTYQPVPQNQPFYQAVEQGQNQSMATASLVLGILSLMFACCYGGIPFGAGALALGIFSMKNINENSMQYGGRGMAIAGIVMGVIGLLFSLGLLLIVIISG